MIQELVNSVKGELTGMLSQKAGLTPQQATASLGIAQDEVADGLKKEALSGNVSNLMNLFKGGQDVGSSPIVTNIANQYAGSLMAKLGLPEGVSKTVATVAIPFIMRKLQTKTAGKSEEDIVDMFDGDNGFMDVLKKGMSKLGGLFR